MICIHCNTAEAPESHFICTHCMETIDVKRECIFITDRNDIPHFAEGRQIEEVLLSRLPHSDPRWQAHCKLVPESEATA